MITKIKKIFTIKHNPCFNFFNYFNLNYGIIILTNYNLFSFLSHYKKINTHSILFKYYRSRNKIIIYIYIKITLIYKNSLLLMDYQREHSIQLSILKKEI